MSQTAGVVAAWHRAAAFAWAAAAAAGMLAVQAYEATPGDAGRPPADWPVASTLPFEAGAVNLVLFAHPHCPCTAASLDELARLLARVDGRVAARVAVFSAGPGWERGPGWSVAESIPGVRPVADPDGAEAARFGARTSGHVMAFDPSGRRIYSGGITGSRGHRGDNPGEDVLRAAILGRAPGRPGAPVFGCPISEAPRQAGVARGEIL